VAIDLGRMRREYEAEGLDPDDLAEDPIDQFNHWFGEAVDAGLTEANAMVVSTVDPDGQPWSRFVLLKAVTAAGFDFYTNYGSAKSSHLADNPRVALTFGWIELRRQVNITGIASRVPDDESDAYWAVRPRGSQLGGLASPQSRPVASRQELLDRYDEAERAHPDAVARPPHWGGWRVRPRTIEFWQGRTNRLHDRLRYVPVQPGPEPDPGGDGGAVPPRWRVLRLAP
jgi:pyridoxamine 5'-phosphate oxidase